MLEESLYKQVADVVPILCVDGIIQHEDKFLLVKRRNQPLKGKYWLPGGRVHKNETLNEAFHRKMREELGIEVEITGLAGFYEDFYDKNELGIKSVHTVSVVFKAKPLSLDVTLDSQSEDYIWSETLPKLWLKR